MEDFPITLEDWTEIFSTIRADRTEGLIPMEPPLFFLHAGQPGCGKTELNNLIKRQLEGNILECNADNLRDYHPDVDKILRDREIDYPTLTWPAANSWNNSLIDEGISHLYNLLIETTLRNQEQALATFTRMKNNGYKTHLNVLSVPYRWSWLGIHLRYEALKLRKGFARTVSEADHDERYQQLPVSLDTVIKSPFLDQVAIYRRKLTIDKDATTAIELVTSDKSEALDAFRQNFEKVTDSTEWRLFKSNCERVIEYMENRGAPEDIISAFSEKADQLVDL